MIDVCDDELDGGVQDRLDAKERGSNADLLDVLQIERYFAYSWDRLF